MGTARAIPCLHTSFGGNVASRTCSSRTPTELLPGERTKHLEPGGGGVTTSGTASMNTKFSGSINTRETVFVTLCDKDTLQ